MCWASLFRVIALEGMDRLEWRRGETAAEQRVENHAARPDVHLRSRVHASGDHLGCRVVWRSAGRVEKAAVLQEVGETEVGDLDVVVFVEQEVLRL